MVPQQNKIPKWAGVENRVTYGIRVDNATVKMVRQTNKSGKSKIGKRPRRPITDKCFIVRSYERFERTSREETSSTDG